MTRSERRRASADAKSGIDQPHTKPHCDGGNGDKRKWDGDVRVTGEITIQPPPDLLAEYKTAQKDSNTHNRKMRLIGWLTLSAAVIYAGITALQWYDLRNNFKIGQRAWITINALALIGELSTNSYTPINLSGKNTGQSPAIDVHWHVTTASITGPRCGPIRPLKPYVGGGAAIGPGEVFSNPSVGIGALGEECLLDLNTGKATLLFGESITYRDIFGESHITEFQTLYEGLTTRKLSVTPDHNGIN